MEWMPIESAPRDDSPMLGLLGGTRWGALVDAVYFNTERSGFYTAFNGVDVPPQRVYPTHWMPLPAPPKKPEGE